jgi:hypothetical protein
MDLALSSLRTYLQSPHLKFRLLNHGWPKTFVHQQFEVFPHYQFWPGQGTESDCTDSIVEFPLDSRQDPISQKNQSWESFRRTFSSESIEGYEREWKFTNKLRRHYGGC